MIEGQVLLTQIKNNGLPGAIIAGGYVRDHIMKGKFKDIDIFLPVHSKNDYYEKINALKEHLPELTVDPGPKEKYKGYKTFYTSDFIWNNIPVQIIGHRIREENFPEELMESFNFCIDRMYYDGTDTIVTPEAQRDIDLGTATLCSLKELSYTPIAVKKFNRLQEKYPTIQFKTTCLELKKELKLSDKRPNTKDDKVQEKKDPWQGWFDAPDEDLDRIFEMARNVQINRDQIIPWPFKELP